MKVGVALLWAIVAIVAYILVTRKAKGTIAIPFYIPMPGDGGKRPVMFGRDSCPYTVKMKEQLEDDGVMSKFEYVDVTTDEGEERFSAVGGEGVPTFELNGRIAIGAMPTSKLIKILGM